jgi:hypothetical protein
MRNISDKIVEKNQHAFYEVRSITLPENRAHYLAFTFLLISFLTLQRLNLT